MSGILELPLPSLPLSAADVAASLLLSQVLCDHPHQQPQASQIISDHANSSSSNDNNVPISISTNNDVDTSTSSSPQSISLNNYDVLVTTNYSKRKLEATDLLIVDAFTPPPKRPRRTSFNRQNTKYHHGDIATSTTATDATNVPLLTTNLIRCQQIVLCHMIPAFCASSVNTSLESITSLLPDNTPESELQHLSFEEWVAWTFSQSSQSQRRHHVISDRLYLSLLSVIQSSQVLHALPGTTAEESSLKIRVTETLKKHRISTVQIRHVNETGIAQTSGHGAALVLVSPALSVSEPVLLADLRRIIPISQMASAVSYVHSVKAHHAGCSNSWERLQEEFAWVPRDIVRECVSRCTRCQQKRIGEASLKNPLNIISTARLWERLQLEIIDYAGVDSIAHIMDHYSRFHWTMCLKGQDRRQRITTILHLLLQITSMVGPPKYLQTTDDDIYTNISLQTLLTQWNTQHEIISTGIQQHPSLCRETSSEADVALASKSSEQKQQEEGKEEQEQQRGNQKQNGNSSDLDIDYSGCDRYGEPPYGVKEDMLDKEKAAVLSLSSARSYPPDNSEWLLSLGHNQLLSLISQCSASHQHDWMYCVAQATWTLNSTSLSHAMIPPYQLVFGSKPRSQGIKKETQDDIA